MVLACFGGPEQGLARIGVAVGKARLLGLGVPSLSLEEHPWQRAYGNVHLLLLSHILVLALEYVMLGRDAIAWPFSPKF